MRRWTWLAILALVGALVIIPWATSTFAQGPTEPENPAPSWEEMVSYCQGAEAMMGGGMMGGDMMGSGMMGW